MVNIKKFLGSKTGIIVFSIILGLGFSCMFKFTCDTADCIIYKAPDLKEKKIMKYNNNCYEMSENIVTCDTNKKIINV